MKKYFSIVLAALLTFSLMAGCGGNNAQSAPAPAPSSQSSSTSNPKDKKELVFWAPFAGGDFEFMKTMVDQYNASSPEYTVEFLSKDWGDSYYQSINSSLIASNGPDVFILHQSKLAEFIPTGKLAKINEINASIDWSSYNDAQYKSVLVDDVQYAIPLDTHALVMFYNKDILSRAGVTEADLKAVNSIQTWEAILEKISKVIKENEHVLDVVSSGANTIQQFWTWYVLNAQAGGTFLDGKQAGLNSNTGIQAMDLLKSWNQKGYIKNGIEDGSSYDLFKSGAAAIQLTGVWATGNFESAKELNFGVMPIPAITGEQKTWGDSHTFAVPNYISQEKQIAAVKFADWINDHAITWAQAGHVPAKKAVMQSAEYKAMPYRSDYADVINYVVYYPSNEKLGACIELASSKVSQIFSNNLESKKAMDEVKSEIDAILAR